MIRSLTFDHPKQWDLILPQAEFAFNSMENGSTKHPPFSIVYTKKPNHTLDHMCLPKITSIVAHNLAMFINSTILEVKQNLAPANELHKSIVDWHKRHQVFVVGDLVMVDIRKQRIPASANHKLFAKKMGPYPITHKINDNAYHLELPSSL